MNVIVDTSIWSLALRRNKSNIENPNVKIFKDLITAGKVILLGAIRQEVLSGIRHQEQFIKLRDYLRAFPDLEITIEDYELAATFFNTCRSKGIQGSNTDFLICAVAHNHNYKIFTTDQDFAHFKQYLPIVLL